VPALDLAIVSMEWDVVDLVESCGGFRIIGFFDPVGPSVQGELECFGADGNWDAVKQRFPSLHVALAIDDPRARARLFDHYGADAIVTMQSPHAYVSSRATIGKGSILQRGVTVMPRAHVGRACKLNVNATIHHDACIGDFCTIAPGAQILGNVRIADRVYIGAGAIVRQRCAVAADATVGAGAVVVRDVPPNAIVAGVPASRRLK
jgi:sugar O-acyltransferase (sialic acid O-acetyltransferase NeuD family)